MARNLKWSELKTGVIALAVIVGLAVSVLLFARVGALHGDTSDVYVVTDDAMGVLSGTEVWLSGEKVGLVKDVHFRPVTTDTLQRVAIHTEILSQYLHLVRKDSYADIRPGGNLIGSPVVYIASGTSRAGGLETGDTLVTRSNSMMKPVGTRVTSLGARVTALADSGVRVIALLNSQMGTLGKLGTTGFPKIAATTAEISSMMANATRGKGTTGQLLQGDVRARVAHIQAAKDSIVLLMSSGDGNIGRFRRDSTLIRTVAHLRSEIDSMRVTYSGGNGITRARSDSALSIQMARIRVELAAVMADLKKRPLQYISF